MAKITVDQEACIGCDAPSGHVCLAGSASSKSVKCGSHLICPGGASGGMPVAVIAVGSPPCRNRLRRRHNVTT